MTGDELAADIVHLVRTCSFEVWWRKCEYLGGVVDSDTVLAARAILEAGTLPDYEPGQATFLDAHDVDPNARESIAREAELSLIGLIGTWVAKRTAPPDVADDESDGASDV